VVRYSSLVRISTRRIELTKRYPLTISRGTITGSTNLVVTVTHNGIRGWGEMAPSDVTGDTAETAELAVKQWDVELRDYAPSAMQRITTMLGAVPNQGSAIRAALDMACYDWLGKRTGLPVWQLLGVDRERSVPTSLTIGINPADVVEERTAETLVRTGARVLKVKLGQQAGYEADQEMFDAAQRGAKRAFAVTGIAPQWRVDANGGWRIDVAKTMVPWLADREVTYVEQPLAEGDEENLKNLYLHSELPIFADESIHSAGDVADLADRIHGVNLKLMKCGGISGALAIIHTARAHRLQVMIGCMGESSLAISAGAAIGGLVDHLDLDSHLNLTNDPFSGAEIVDGVVKPNDGVGLGVQIRAGFEDFTGEAK
jgi:L-Ala-D/L-Glu epimerase